MKQELSDILEQVCTKGSVYDDMIDYLLLGYDDSLKNALISDLSICLYPLFETGKKINNIESYIFTILRNLTRNPKDVFYVNNLKLIDEKGLFNDNKYQEDLQEIKDDYKDRLSASIKTARNNVKNNYFDQEVFKMHYDNNLTYRDIRDVSNSSIGAVHAGVRRVLSKLKKECLSNHKQ